MISADAKDSFYARVSIVKKDRASTIEQQITALRDAGFNCDPEFEFMDPGESGTIRFEQRPGGRALLEAARAGKIRRVYVYSSDRLGRTAGDMHVTLEELIDELGIEVISLNEGDLKDDMLRGVYAAKATKDRKDILRKTKHGSVEKSKDGRCMGGRYITYGYMLQDRRLVPDPERAPVVVYIHELAAKGFSSPEIIRKLDIRGIPYQQWERARINGERSSSPPILMQPEQWTRHRIQGIIRNPIYKGIDVYGKRHIVHHKNPIPGRKLKYSLKKTEEKNQIVRNSQALVTPELWEQANAGLHANQIERMAHPKPGNEYLLTGLVKCAECGQNYIGHRSVRPNGKQEFYYRRSYGEGNRKPGHVCACISGVMLEDAIRKNLTNFLRDSDHVLSELRDKMGTAADRQERLSGEVELLEAALKRNEEEQRLINGRYFKGMLTENDLDGFLEAAARDRKTIEHDLAEARGRMLDAEADRCDLEGVGSVLDQLCARLDKGLSFADWREITRTLVAEVHVYRAATKGESRAKVVFRFIPRLTARLESWATATRLSPGVTVDRNAQRLTLEKVIVFPGKPRHARPLPATGPVTPPTGPAKPVATPIHSKTRSGRVTKAVKRA